MDSLNDAQFLRRYKLNKLTFFWLTNKLRDHVGTGSANRYAVASSGSGIPTELCLSMTLRWLAGGHDCDIVDMHGVASSTFYSLLWKTVAAINKVLELPGLRPDDTDQLENLAKGFHTLSKGTMKGCVAAIDGIAIEIQKPSSWDTVNPLQFLNRKCFFSINCQAMCDSHLRFLWASMKSPGGTHDSLAWSVTDMCSMLKHNPPPRGYYIVGDDAYVGSDYMMTPYPGRKSMTKAKSAFNFYQSRCRITIERAFGVLVQRWGILRRALRGSLFHNVAAIRCCMRLHNLCIDQKIHSVDPMFMPCDTFVSTATGHRKRHRDQDVAEGDAFRPFRQSEGLSEPAPCETVRARAAAVMTLRDEVCEGLRLQGRVRPATSKHGIGITNAQRRKQRKI